MANEKKTVTKSKVKVESTTKKTSAEQVKEIKKPVVKKVATEAKVKETKKPALAKKATSTKKPVIKKESAPKKVIKKITTKKDSKTKKDQSDQKLVEQILSTETTDGKINVATINVDVKKDQVKSKFLGAETDQLNEVVFKVAKNYDQAIFDTILSERASRRQGTHHTKTRAEVSGTGKKPFRQKGTGNARQGTLRAPHMRGGGVALGPRNQVNYHLKVNKSTRRHALNAALSYLAQANAVAISDLKMNDISTKALIEKLKELNADNLRKVLIVSADQNLFLSARNLANVKVTKVSSLLVEDLIGADALILSATDIEYLERLLG